MLPVLAVALLDMRDTSDRSGQRVLNEMPKNPRHSGLPPTTFSRQSTGNRYFAIAV